MIRPDNPQTRGERAIREALAEVVQVGAAFDDCDDEWRSVVNAHDLTVGGAADEFNDFAGLEIHHLSPSTYARISRSRHRLPLTPDN